MSVDLSLIIADLENKIAAADSNTPILDLLQMVTAAERLTGGKNVYDSAGLLPTGNQYEGTIAMTADGTIRVYSGESGGWDTLDSSSYTAPSGYSFQGSVSGYTSGGSFSKNEIDKFPFSSDANATDVGDLLGFTAQPAGQSSTASGYTSGGTTPVATYDTVIQKFSFSADGNSTDVGDLTIGRRWLSGQSSENSGYSSGGQNPTHPTASAGALNTIDKFPFSADANATDVGDLSVTSYSLTGQSSTENGYSSGGSQPSRSDVIDKFPFASDGNATDVGNLLQRTTYVTGQSSTTHGYTVGGTDYVGSPILTTTIQKHSFSVDGNATDVGDLLSKLQLAAGQSSSASGYTSGGDLSPGFSNVIQKHSFSSDGNSTDVGDLTVARYNTAGQQV